MTEVTLGAGPKSNVTVETYLKWGIGQPSGRKSFVRTISDTLSRSAPFSSLPPGELAWLAGVCRERRLAPGAVLYDQGEPPEGLYLIRAGVVKLVVSANDGRQAILCLSSAGDLLAEVALIDGRPHGDSAVALTSIEAVFVPAAAFWSAIERAPAAMRAVAQLLCERLRRASSEVVDRAWLDARARVAKRLLDLADAYGRPSPGGATEISLPLTQSDLAQLVGAGRESVNRAMRQFREAGAVAIWSGRLVVLDPVMLARYADVDAGEPVAGRAA